MEKVIPDSLNYADVKPETIENMVRLVRFVPTSNVQQAKPNDVVRFNMQSNGFLDPFSTYIKFRVNLFPNNDSVAKKADGSQMTAGEMAADAQDDAMANKRPYSETSEMIKSDIGVFRGKYLDRSAHSFIQRMIIRSQGTEIERIEQYDVLAAMINDMIYSHEQKQIHHQEGFPTKKATWPPRQMVKLNIGGGAVTSTNIPRDAFPLDPQTQSEIIEQAGDIGWSQYVRKANQANLMNTSSVQGSSGKLPTITQDPEKDGAWQSGAYMEADQVTIPDDALNTGPHTLEFTIPIYSGILGVLMPDKKLIPLSLLPLEVEFSLNPYAVYAVQPRGANGSLNREYTVTNFEIYGHMLFFEQEVHRSLEEVVAQQGVFIHFNTFYLAPVSVNAGSIVNPTAQINIHFKSINSIHFVFIYHGYETNPNQRKLHFSPHGISQLQIRNGTDLIPSEPIRGDMRRGAMGQHSQILTETFKGWNKMHDPKTDSALSQLNFCLDDPTRVNTYHGQTVSGLMKQQSMLGRCQYAISLEGEELAKDKSTVTGRRGLTPFDILQTGTKTEQGDSYQITFVRADFVIYVRPDLVVTVLGR